MNGKKLVKCGSCGHEVWWGAEKCPNCGCPTTTQTAVAGIAVGIGIGVFFALIWLFRGLLF